jgi:hypothetical protein
MASRRESILMIENGLMRGLLSKAPPFLAIKEMVRKSPTFALYQVKDALDFRTTVKKCTKKGHFSLRELDKDVIGPVMCCSPKNILSYLSDPTKTTPGAFTIVDKCLVYSPYGLNLEGWRDSELWGYALNNFYTHWSMQEIVRNLHEPENFSVTGLETFLYAPDWRTHVSANLLSEEQQKRLDENYHGTLYAPRSFKSIERDVKPLRLENVKGF